MSESEEFSKLSSVKSCPNCGGNLNKGYFAAPRGFYWSTEKHKASLIFFDTMMPRVSSAFTADYAPALRCENCGIAILDYCPRGVTPKSFLKNCVKCGEEIPIAAEQCSRCSAEQP